MRNLRKIVAVRHGDYLSSHGGLTEKGIQQAQLLGQTIKELCTPPRWGWGSVDCCLNSRTSQANGEDYRPGLERRPDCFSSLAGKWRVLWWNSVQAGNWGVGNRWTPASGDRRSFQGAVRLHPLGGYDLGRIPLRGTQKGTRYCSLSRDWSDQYHPTRCSSIVVWTDRGRQNRHYGRQRFFLANDPLLC